jgi:hypothetical protein
MKYNRISIDESPYHGEALKNGTLQSFSLRKDVLKPQKELPPLKGGLGGERGPMINAHLQWEMHEQAYYRSKVLEILDAICEDDEMAIRKETARTWMAARGMEL